MAQFGDKQGWVTALSANDSTAREPLGIRRTEVVDEIRRVYAYVKNAEATSAFAAGDCLKWDDLVENEAKLGAAQGDIPAGVAIGAITAGNYGWIQVKGYHAGVKAHASTAAGDAMIMATNIAGRTAKNTAPTNTVVAWALGAHASDKNPALIVVE